MLTPKYSAESNEFGSGLGNIEGRKRTLFSQKSFKFLTLFPLPLKELNASNLK